jgi:hypothetical protein
MPHDHFHQTEPRPGYISSGYAMGMELDGAGNQSGGVSGLKRVYVSGVDAYLSEFMRGKMAAAVRNCFGIAHLDVIME